MMAFAEALKPKTDSSHLKTIINAEGKEILAETRNDEQQAVKYQEIIELLLGAGYYRAQIKGLSEFDKVVGGMTWCIVICKMDLDVDLLFQENSTIGQKIALTEKIVAVLPNMKCPYAIEPHQIQGLDFIHIHPVIEWLVKRSLENRDERGDYLCLYAVHQFNKNYTFPHEKPDDNFIQSALQNVKTVQEKYGPQRKYRRIEAQPTDTMSRVESTLFEYGHAPLQEDESEEGGEFKGEVVDEVRLQKLITSMTAAHTNIAVGPGTVNSIVEKCIVELEEAEKVYCTLHSNIDHSDLTDLKKLQEKEKYLSVLKDQLQKELGTVSNALEEVKESNYDTDSLQNLSSEDQTVIKSLEAMLLTIVSLEEQQAQFKEQCRTELTHWQTLIKESEDEYVSDGENVVLDINKQLVETRMRLAKMTRAIVTIERLLDEVPSRAELAQYQRRFLELYYQVSAKHRETKKYYALYNTLNDIHHCLNKELTLLNSILDGYNETLVSQSNKEQFMKQFDNIVDGIKHYKAKVEQKRNEEREVQDKYKSQLQGLLEKQRLCAAAVKQFTSECLLNENILAQLKQATANKLQKLSLNTESNPLST